MYKLLALTVCLAFWLTNFFMGIARVEHAGGDGDGDGNVGGDGDGAGNGAMWNVPPAPTRGTGCRCTSATSCTCLFELAGMKAPAELTSGQCSGCTADGVCSCVLPVVVMHGSECFCDAVTGVDGDGAAADRNCHCKFTTRHESSGAKDGDADTDAHGDGDADGDGNGRVYAVLSDEDGDGDADTDGRDGDADTDGRDGDADTDGRDGDADTDGRDGDADTDGRDGDADADADVDVDADGDGDADADAHDGDADGQVGVAAAPECYKHVTAFVKGTKCTCAQAGAVVAANTGCSGKENCVCLVRWAQADAPGKNGDASADGDADADGNDGDANADGADADGNDGDANADGDADADGQDGGDGSRRAFHVAENGDGDGDADGNARTVADADADGDAASADGDGGVFRPKWGVIDGLGCTGKGGCSGSEKFPYYVWAKFVNGNSRHGGQLYFEWRGDAGEVVAWLMLAWVVLFLMMAVVGLTLKGRYQRPLCGGIGMGSVRYYLDAVSLVPLQATWAELAVGFWIVGWCVLCFLYVWNHAYINQLVGPVPRGFGGVVAGLLTIQLFPVSRKSFLLYTFGIPFERALAAHRRIGLYVLLFMTMHGLGMWVAHYKYYKYGQPLRGANGAFTGEYNTNVTGGLAAEEAIDRLMAWKIGFPHGPPLAGFLSWFVMTAMAGAALCRRAHWNMFVIVHAGYAVLYPLAWIHYPSLMIFSGVPLLLYAVDVLAREFGAMRDEAVVKDVRVEGGITRLTLNKKSLSYEPGQWVQVRVPAAEEGCVAEYHPLSPSFYLSEADGSTTFTLHAKDMGDGTWTNRLQRVQKGDTVKVYGGYGSLMLNMEKASTCYIFAGGVGLTPVLSLLTYYVKMAKGTAAENPVPVRTPNFVVVWTYRGEAVFRAFQEELVALQPSAHFTIDWNLHNTAKGLSDDPKAQAVSPLPADSIHFRPDTEAPKTMPDEFNAPYYHFKSGRPHWEDYICTAPAHSVGFVCGPRPLTSQVQALAFDQGLPLHSEVFEM